MAADLQTATDGGWIFNQCHTVQCSPARLLHPSHLHPISTPHRLISMPCLQVDHFLRFADDERQMPVVWHQCLLCFVQRYKDEIRPEDRGNLRKLCSVQHHYQVWGGGRQRVGKGRAGEQMMEGQVSCALVLPL